MVLVPTGSKGLSSNRDAFRSSADLGLTARSRGQAVSHLITSNRRITDFVCSEKKNLAAIREQPRHISDFVNGAW